MEHHPHLREHHTATEPAPLLEFCDFCFAYEDRPVLRHIDLHIHAGDSVVLMGDNGSGKSTLLKAINGLVFPQRGTFTFDGAAVTEATMKDAAFAKRLHQQIGFIFQDSDAQLFCASVEDEIAFGPRQMGLPESEVAQRVNDVCALLDLAPLRARAPYNLSGGEKKKVAIACILSMSPSVYCFDEPLNGLDKRTREWLLGFLHQLKDAGKTLIVATHDQSLADEVADYFVFMGCEHGYTDKPHIHIN
ncbi:MAG: ABC transporter ATP-binding protein [Coriobacteriia bacterium]|nr:ABC transporter ATP-binding protein [Coriobacteriia bacterium]